MARKVEVLRFLLLALQVLRDAAVAGNFFSYASCVWCERLRVRLSTVVVV